MFFYRRAFGASAVLGGGGRGEVPFYVRGAGDKWDVVEIDYLPSSASEYLGRGWFHTLSISSNFGCEICQYSSC
jgi:hypothetical protein